MKKNKVDIIKIMVLFLVYIAAIFASQYFLYILFDQEREVSAFLWLLAGFCGLYFFLLPLLEHLFSLQKAKMVQDSSNRKREKLAGALASVRQEMFYRKDFAEGVANCQRGIRSDAVYYDSVFQLALACGQIAVYLLFIGHISTPLLVAAGLFLAVNLAVKYQYAKKDFNYGIANVADERNAEYLKNLLIHPEAMRDIKQYGYEDAIASQSAAFFDKGIRARYQMRRQNAFWYEAVKCIFVCSIAASVFLMVAIGREYTFHALLLLVVSFYRMIGVIDPASEAFSDYARGREGRMEYERFFGTEGFLETGGIFGTEGFLRTDGFSCPQGGGGYAFGAKKIERIETVEFRDVSFSYQGQADAVEHVNLVLDMKRKVSLIGENGSGKSTLVKLLLGILQPTRGEILVNGIDRREIDFGSYIRCFGVCLQDGARFSDSIRNNALLGRDGAGNLAALAEMVGLDGKIGALKDGWDTMLGKELYPDGTELSGGEWQKLLICRSLCMARQCYVFDEPTVSLDADSEVDFFHFLKDQLAGEMAVFITHRIGFAKIAGRILVMERGRIVEDGTHEELMGLRGKYYAMYCTQKEMYQEGTV